jgi:hypothetical protein
MQFEVFGMKRAPETQIVINLSISSALLHDKVVEMVRLCLL